jgi:hypothetical protein
MYQTRTESDLRSVCGKGKVVPVRPEDVLGSGGIAPRILGLDGGEWSASRPGRFILGTHWIGRCSEEQKTSLSLPAKEPWSSSQ